MCHFPISKSKSCCPSRTAIQTGSYSHTNKVWTNVWTPWSPYGAWPAFEAAGDERGTIAFALDRAGYRTGLYTQPHLTSFRERMQIDGEPLPAEMAGDHATEALVVLDEED